MRFHSLVGYHNKTFLTHFVPISHLEGFHNIFRGEYPSCVKTCENASLIHCYMVLLLKAGVLLHD